MPTLPLPDLSTRTFSVAMPTAVHDTLAAHLLKRPGQDEDLAFALWTPSVGTTRVTALVHTVVLPEPGDRQVHGNASFNLPYFERVLDLAVQGGFGVAFLHSHLGPGWQDMSPDDVRAEAMLAPTANTVTDLPLFGLTLGTDGTWSARAWRHVAGRRHEREWCESVRVVGPRLTMSYNDRLVPPPMYREEFKRTQTVWGPSGHRQLARLRVGIVGLGSVGMGVAECLARSGVERFSLIDFDEIQTHNADRLQGTDNRFDVGRLKIGPAQELIERAATAAAVDVRVFPHSVVEDEGYRAALDCDVLFSCVDRPRARQILNHIAYAHLVPVIDGGIAVRFREDARFKGAEWQVQVASPGLPCLECLETFTGSDADTERAGKLDDPSYMSSLPSDHRLKRNENVAPFAMNLASLEVMKFIGLAAGLPAVDASGIQRFYFVAGLLETDPSRACAMHCDIGAIVGSGDTHFLLTGLDHAAAAARIRQRGG